jgi:hypothetical protein
MTEWDLTSMTDAAVEADRQAEKHGGRWEPVDRGPRTSPRYGTVRVPEVGEPVSRTLNGDCYPDGTVVRVTKTQIVTDTGHVYRRKGQTASWKDGPWYLTEGHERRWNPEV